MDENFKQQLRTIKFSSNSYGKLKTHILVFEMLKQIDLLLQLDLKV